MMRFTLAIWIGFGSIYLTQPIQARTSEERRYLQILRHSSFDNAITSGTRIKKIYQLRCCSILFYINAPPETGHQFQKIVVLRHGLFSHDYSAGSGDPCWVAKRDVVCRDDDFISRAKISDILRGDPIVLGGECSEAYYGRKVRYPPHDVCKPRPFDKVLPPDRRARGI